MQQPTRKKPIRKKASLAAVSAATAIATMTLTACGPEGTTDSDAASQVQDSQKQGGGSQQEDTGSQEQGGGSQQEGTGSQEQGGGSQEEGTGSEKESGSQKQESASGTSDGRTGTQAGKPAKGETYAAYSRITERSAGQFWSGGKVAGQWSWRTEGPGKYSISWNKDKPEEREDFVRSKDGKWLLLNGWSDNGTYYTQRVTSERIGDASCQNMKPIPSDGSRQHYVKWNIPDTGYCLVAKGTITEKSSGKVIHFKHRQVWSPPQPCSNAHFKNRVCITQHETWWDDNHHPWKKTLDRKVYLAKGLGMAFKVRQTFPSKWGADLRHVWTY